MTCLIDLFRPEIAAAAVRLLEACGCEVAVPPQGCCGQPNYNSGDRDGARQIARRVVERLAGYEHVVAPSGSCAAMLSRHYPELLADDAEFAAAARTLAGRTFELTDYLRRVRDVAPTATHWPVRATYHDGCAGLRELGIHDQPRELLAGVTGLTLQELGQADVCCGFGGLFCVKYADVSHRIAERKLADIATTGADYVIAGDLGCLMQIEGQLERSGSAVRAVHVAEVLAGTVAREKAGADN